jgi:predicted N-acetyltransferase YhbS
MSVTTRPASAGDLTAIARTMYAAFKSISDRHNFPPDFDTPETAHSVASLLLGHPKFYGVVAEDNDRLLGSNFIDLRSPIVGLGPISVDPEVQNQGIGRQLMLVAMEEAQRRGLSAFGSCSWLIIIDRCVYIRHSASALGFRCRSCRASH